MKQPVIRVKKGAVIYDDRQAAADAQPWRPRLTPAGRSRRRPPRRGSVFFPLLVLAAALALVFWILPARRSTNSAVLDGWKAELRAEVFEGALLAGVTFIRAGDAPVPNPPPIAIVRFLVSGTGERIAVTEALERSPYTVRARLSDQPRARSISAEVLIGDKKKILAAQIRRSP
jgi:hypothetical protein